MNGVSLILCSSPQDGPFGPEGLQSLLYKWACIYSGSKKMHQPKKLQRTKDTAGRTPVCHNS